MTRYADDLIEIFDYPRTYTYTEKLICWFLWVSILAIIFGYLFFQ